MTIIHKQPNKKPLLENRGGVGVGKVLITSVAHKFQGRVPQFPLQWRVWHNKSPVPVPQIDNNRKAQNT